MMFGGIGCSATPATSHGSTTTPVPPDVSSSNTPCVVSNASLVDDVSPWSAPPVDASSVSSSAASELVEPVASASVVPVSTTIPSDPAASSLSNGGAEPQPDSQAHQDRFASSTDHRDPRSATSRSV